MPIEKRDGDGWGGQISCTFRGPATQVDVGMAAILKGNLRWCTNTIVLAEQRTPTALYLAYSGVWNSLGIGDGWNIDCNSLLTPAGLLPANNSTTPSNWWPSDEYWHQSLHYLYVTKSVAPPPPPGGVDLVAGWNMVAYGGMTKLAAQALAPILPYLVIVWDANGWYFYDPADPYGSDLQYIVNGVGYWVNVTQACRWSW